MSAHKKKNVVAAKSAGIIVGDGKHRRNIHRRLGGLGLACVLIVVALIAGAMYAVHLHSDTVQKNNSETLRFTPKEQSQKQASLGDYDGAQKVLSEQISKAGSNKAKADIYLEQATLAINTQNYTDAMKYARQDEKVLPTSGSAELIAQVATLQGDKQLTRTYLNMALSRVDKNKAGSNLLVRQYQAELDGLET